MKKRKPPIIIIICLLFAVAGCRTVYVPVEKTTVQTEYRDRVRADSVFLRDSIYIREKGDTVYIYKDRLLYRDKLVRDTVHVRDSIAYPVTVEVAKEVIKIPRVYQWSFAIVVIALGAAIGWLLGVILKKSPGEIIRAIIGKILNLFK